MKKIVEKKSLFTGKGDGGRTGLIGKKKVSKGNRRIDVLGELDEFSAVLGLARAASGQELTKTILLAVQHDIYVLMAALAVEGKPDPSRSPLESERVVWLESQIDILTARSKTPTGFILPGDTPVSAMIDFARTVARRVERRVVRQSDRGWQVGPTVLSYLNRVSSLLFALELYELETQSIKPTPAKT